MDATFSKIYYKPAGLYRGLSAIDKLATEANTTKAEAKTWLEKQIFYQIYLPSPRKIIRDSFNESKPNVLHQSDLLFLPRDVYKRKTYKYALTVIDVASRYKEAEPLCSKNSEEVAKAFERIYKRSKLKWPETLQVDPGTEFKGAVTKLFESHGTKIRRGEPNNHKQQALVERFNRTLAESIFGVQYAKEILLASRSEVENKVNKVNEVRNREWVKDLAKHVAKLNDSVTRMIKMKPNDAIMMEHIDQPQSKVKKEELLELGPNDRLRYFYADGELEGQGRRATDPNWSLTMHDIDRVIYGDDQVPLYYLTSGPKRSFVREELQVVPADSELPPAGILK